MKNILIRSLAIVSVLAILVIAAREPHSNMRLLTNKELAHYSGLDKSLTIVEETPTNTSCATIAASDAGSGVIAGDDCNDTNSSDTCIYCGSPNGEGDMLQLYIVNIAPSESGAMLTETDCGALYRGNCIYDMINQKWTCQTTMTNTECGDIDEEVPQDSNDAIMGRGGLYLEPIPKN